jgi:hypothetical protein
VPTEPPVATPTQASAPVFRILGVRIEHQGERPDWQLERPSLKQVTLDSGIRLSLYARFTYLPGISHVNVTADVKLKGRTLYHAGITEDRAGAGDVWDHWNYTPRSLGKYTFTASVKVGGRTRTGSISFTVVRPAKAPSFTFDRLQTFNASGRPASSFSRSARVVVAATITVRNAVGSVSITAGETLERPAGTGWAPLGKRVQNSFVTTNGTHPYSVSFYPQSPYNRLRMVIDLQLGKEKASKAVVFSVHA